MIADLRPYPGMKDSHVPWLGDVPEHWDLLPHRALFKAITQQNHPDEPMLSVTISRGVVRQADLLSETSKKDSSNLDKSKYKLVRPGDIAYNKMRAWQGAIGASTFRGIVSPAYVVQRPHAGVLASYMHYLLRTPMFATEAERWSYGISSDQWSLRPEHFKMIISCLPPLDEQVAIVRFLDHADRQIRRYIRGRQKLVTLLEEQKQVITHRAATCGLDPSVRLRPAGVKGLGEVPEHWEVLPLRRRWSVTDCKHLTVPFVEDGIALASVREVQSFDIALSKAKRTTEEWYTTLTEGGRAPRRGDVIYCRNVSVGAAAFVNTDERFAMGQDVCLMRSSTQNQRFLNYFLHSPAMAGQLAALLIGSTFDRINVADIKGLMVAVPPRPEQDAIAQYLDAALADVERIANDAVGEIGLVREYRARLVADVVTGKVDVRGAAASLPDETEEPELLGADEMLDGFEETEGSDLAVELEEVEA